MPTQEALEVYLQSLAKKTYYDILRITRDATPAVVKSAFHDFSLLYHPDRYVDSQPASPSGRVGDLQARSGSVPVPVPPAAARTLRPGARPRQAAARGFASVHRAAAADDADARNGGANRPGKQFAVKAERLIAVGKLEDARVQLVGACQCEPDNEELAERLQILYEALALEPL